jgi:OmpA-OmpF porin, OOP family
MRRHLALLVSICAAAFAGCATSAIKVEANAASDIDSVARRLHRLVGTGTAAGNFSLAKAQCWLDTAHTQRSENDRTGYVEEAIAEAARIAAALEADRATDAGHATPLIARSTRLREDLWAQLDQLAARGSAPACNARAVACGQVWLVRAGHAEQQTGWRAATPFVQMAEDAVVRARAQAAACSVPTPAMAATPVPAPVAAAAVSPAAAPAVAQSAERFVILSDTLFRFGRSGPQDMLPEGKARLADLAQRLKSYTQVQAIGITGHTDRLGSDAYNDQLSRARAATVRTYFEAAGTQAGSVTAQGKGKREPVTQGCSGSLPRAALVRCLQPDRRVTIEVRGSAP